MNELPCLTKKELCNVRAQDSILILEGLARCSLLPANPQLADNS